MDDRNETTKETKRRNIGSKIMGVTTIGLVGAVGYIYYKLRDQLFDFGSSENDGSETNE